MTGILIAAAVLLLSALAGAVFNLLVVRRNEVRNALAGVDSMLKKRFDLLAPLAEAVSAMMKHEAEVLGKVARSRGALAAEVSRLERFDQESQKAVKQAFAVAEAYPELKSSENLLQLQAALEDVENEIAAARRAYNAAVTGLNNLVEMFPTNLMAAAMGIGRAQPFRAWEPERAASWAPPKV